MHKKRGWNVLLYAILLINIAAVIAYMIFSKASVFIADVDNQKLQQKLEKNIQQKAMLAMKVDVFLNKFTNDFIETVKCPTWAPVLSWVTSDDYYNSASVFSPSYDKSRWAACVSQYSSTWFLWVYYSTDWSDFPFWILKDENQNGNLPFEISDSAWIFTWTWVDPGWKDFAIDFNWYNAAHDSWYNTRYDSDNFNCFSKTTSTWAYGNYCDNDSDWRTYIYWYILKNMWWYNIFWNNDIWSKYIESNVNNTTYDAITYGWSDSFHALPSKTTKWYIKFDKLESWFSIKVVEFDKWLYDDTRELRRLKEWEWSWSFAASGSYMSLSWAEVSFVNTLEKATPIDFKNKNFWIFLSNTIQWSLISYYMQVVDDTWKAMFISPVDDSKWDTLYYLWNDIIYLDNWVFYSKQMEVSRNRYDIPLQ